MRTSLLTDIEAFLAATGMGDYRFGMLAAKNGRLMERLRAGETPKGKPVLLRPETERQVRDFMRANRPKRVAA